MNRDDMFHLLHNWQFPRFTGLASAVNMSDPRQQEAFDRLEAEIDLKSAFKQLTDLEVDVVKLHYGIQTDHTWTHREIGEYFGFSSHKSQKLCNQALKKLKKFFVEEL